MSSDAKKAKYDDTSIHEDIEHEKFIDDDDITQETIKQYSSKNKNNRKLEIEVLDKDALQADMDNTIAEMQSFLDVKTGVCRILLNKYKWQKDTLLEHFYDSPDTTSFLLEAQVIAANAGISVPDKDKECAICCSYGKLRSLACHHQACTECWETYLTDRIRNEGQIDIECMDPSCKLLVDEEMTMSFITDPTVITLYRRLALNSYVATNRLLQWCPSDKCENVLKANECEPCPVVCSCGLRFCFACGEDWHEMLDCRLWKIWQDETGNGKKKNTSSEKKTRKDKALANMKECPKCKTLLQKDGGCNSVKCSNRSCRFNFCWNCTKSMSEHDDSNCHKKSEEVDIGRSLFYFEQFELHKERLNNDKTELPAKVNSKMEEMLKLPMSWMEVQFLKKAVEVLLESRQTLLFTFSFAYFLERENNNSRIFLENQNALGQEIEKLSIMLRQDLRNKNPVELKEMIQDKYLHVAQRRKVLLDHYAEGREQDTWIFTE